MNFPDIAILNQRFGAPGRIACRLGSVREQVELIRQPFGEVWNVEGFGDGRSSSVGRLRGLLNRLFKLGEIPGD